MKKLLLILLVLPISLMAVNVNADRKAGDVEPPNVTKAVMKTVTSPDNRVAVLELYTSEGCSSCPPADRFLSQLKDSGISSKQLIPMAFHVTYWDYIGWNDRFAKEQFDLRQRELAQKNNLTTIYTPQFLLSGDDYRRYSSFNSDINKLVKQKSLVDLKLSSYLEKQESDEKLHLEATADISKSQLNAASLYFVVLEHNLTSRVEDGENEGENLHHDYVVREMHGPYFQKNDDKLQPLEQKISIKPEWKKQDISVVLFAENPKTGEVLQAVRLNQI